MKWIMPEKTEWAKSCNAHEPTRSYGEEIFNITREFTKGKKVRALEIGAAWGVSALALLMGGVDNLVSVDSDPGVKAPAEVLANGFIDKWEFKHMTSEIFFMQNTQTFDLVYVDGSHKYPTCQDDIFSGWECLNEGGILIADDFTHPKNQAVDPDSTVEYGVSYAVCNLICEKKLKRIDSTSRLFIAYK